MNIEDAKNAFYRIGQAQQAKAANDALAQRAAQLSAKMQADAANTPNLTYGSPAAVSTLPAARQAQIASQISAYNKPTGDWAAAANGDQKALSRIRMATAAMGAKALASTSAMSVLLRMFGGAGAAIPAFMSSGIPPADTTGFGNRAGGFDGPATITRGGPQSPTGGNNYYGMLANLLQGNSQPTEKP